MDARAVVSRVPSNNFAFSRPSTTRAAEPGTVDKEMDAINPDDLSPKEAQELPYYLKGLSKKSEERSSLSARPQMTQQQRTGMSLKCSNLRRGGTRFRGRLSDRVLRGG